MHGETLKFENLWGICGGKVALKHVFLCVLQYSLVSIIPL